jgi:hypothetical protein
MASAAKKTTVSGSFCVDNALPSSSSSSISRAAASAASAPVSASAGNAPQDWTVASIDHRDDQLGKKVAMASMIRAVDSLPEPSANASSKGSFSVSVSVSLCLYLYTYTCIYTLLFCSFCEK